MSDEKMTIDDVNELLKCVLDACLVLHSQLGHDFGSEVTTAGDTKFKLIFERIDD